MKYDKITCNAIYFSTNAIYPLIYTEESITITYNNGPFQYTVRCSFVFVNSNSDWLK